MTAIASAGAGNWGTAGTWNPAQVPTAGDTVTITHAIAYDVDDDVNAIGAITINAGGSLVWSAGAQKSLRLGGILTLNGGGIVGRAGTFLRILPGYYINVNNVAGSDIDFQGTVPNFATTLISGSAIGNGRLLVADETGFGVGDWVSVFDKDDIDYDDRDAEGFIVNATEAGVVGLRRRVGPEFALSRTVSIGDSAIYTTGSVGPWRGGMHLILDTEVFVVASVDKHNRIINVSGTASAGHTSGTMAYESGCEKAHAATDDVYKLCTTLVGAVSGSSYVDVVNADGWAAADVLGVAGEWYPGCEEVTIDSISAGGGAGGSDRISLTGVLTRTYTAGRPIVKLNRDCVIHGASSETAVSNGGYINDTSWGGTNRKYQLYNTELRCVGNSASIYYGGAVGTGGSTYNGGRKFLNLSSHNAYAAGQCGAIGNYWSSYMSAHNCVLFNVGCGLANDGTNTSAIFNCFVIGGNISIGWRLTTGYQTDYGYCLTMSCREWATYIQGSIGLFRGTTDGQPTNAFHDLVAIADNYAIFMGGGYSGSIPFRTKCINPRYRAIYKEWNCGPISPANWYGAYYGLSQYEQVTYWRIAYTRDFQNGVILLHHFGGDPDEAKAIYNYGWGERDRAIRKHRAYSWKLTPKNNESARAIGFGAEIFADAGRPIAVQAWVRKSSDFNGTGPFIQMLNQSNAVLASDTISVAHSTWELLSITYAPTETGPLCILIAGYGTLGTFWIDSPTLDASGCHHDAGVMSPEWSQGNLAGGVRMAGGRING